MAGSFDDFKRRLLKAAPPATVDRSFENLDEDEDEDNPREPTEEEVARATRGLIQTARTAVHLKRVYPPAPHDEAATYVGGLPRMPADLAWPRHERMGWTDNGHGPRGKIGEWSMNFAAQIDLADLPWFPDRVLLPREGALYVFVNTQYDMSHEGWVKVLYSPESPSRHPVREPPADLMPIRDYDGYQPYPWLPIDDSRSRIFDRYVLEPMLVQTYREDTSHDARPWGLGRGHEAAKEALDRAAMRTLEPPAEYDPYLRLGLKDEAWPYANLFVSAALDILPHAMQGRMRLPLIEGPGLDALVERVAAEHARILEETETWRAKAASPFSLLSTDDHQAFRAWWSTVEQRFDTLSSQAREAQALAIKQWHAAGASLETRPGAHLRSADDLRALLTRSTELALETCYRHSAAIAALAPEATTRNVKQVYRSGYWPRFPEHQMLGHGLRVRDDPPDPDENVLLLQLAPDDGLHWLRVLCIQVWISPRDLAERRFDRAYATLGK